jgi:general secretion pathway protein K
MITVLWVMTVAAIVAAAGALSGRNAVNAATNRVHLARAFWIASGCVARARAAIDTALAAAPSFEEAANRWRVLRRVVLPVPGVDPADCAVSLEAAGTRLDMNGATEEMLQNLFVAIGYRNEADALTAALADWRDSDDVTRPEGAERDWYATERRELPRNAPLADIRELSRVRGFANLGALESFLTAEPGHVSLATAPATVLLAVPGFTRETADQVIALQDAGTPVTDVTSLLGLVSRSSADSMLARFPDIVRVTTPDPDAWILTARSIVGVPPVAVTLSHRLLRAGKRAVVVSSRSEL